MASAVRAQGLDKFYTQPEVAKECIDAIGMLFNWNSWELVVEPSAGGGSFLLQIPVERRVGLDVEPEHESVIQQDFFTYTPPDVRRILVVGNPPFGRICSLAVQFFNHAAQWASVIAFIVPRTFRRVSIQNRLDANFWLIHDTPIRDKPCAFSPPMAVKCCFQVWERRETARPPIELPAEHADWEFLAFGPKDSRGQPTPPGGADFAVRAYGGKCGEIAETGLATLRPKSWHWIRSKIDKKVLIERFASLDYSISLNTARQNSIGRAELVKLYADKY